MQVKFGKWKSCATDNPKKDGDYLVLGFYEGALTYSAVLHYSVEYGWNIRIDSNGIVHTDTRIDFSEDTEPGYRIWCDMTEFEGDDDNEPRPHKIYT